MTARRFPRKVERPASSLNYTWNLTTRWPSWPAAPSCVGELCYRYERGSVLLSSNLPFSKGEQIFKDPMTTAAAINRLIHHSVIIVLNIPSCRSHAFGEYLLVIDHEWYRSRRYSQREERFARASPEHP